MTMLAHVKYTTELEASASSAAAFHSQVHVRYVMYRQLDMPKICAVWYAVMITGN
jgi:hypothetical protein